MIERKDKAWKKAAADFETAKIEVEPVIAELKRAREKIIALAGEESARGFGVEATRKRRAGSVNYADIPELLGVDLAAYRRTTRSISRLDSHKPIGQNSPPWNIS